MNLDQARYIVAVNEYLTNHPSVTLTSSPRLRLSPICPECDLPGNPDDFDDPHAVLTTTEGPIVVIGCEGYKTIDPNLVGIDAPNWEPVSTDEPAQPTSNAWANAFGIWHVRVSRNQPLPTLAASDLLREQLCAREARVAREVWMFPERVPELDTAGTLVYREGKPRETEE